MKPPQAPADPSTDPWSAELTAAARVKPAGEEDAGEDRKEKKKWRDEEKEKKREEEEDQSAGFQADRSPNFKIRCG